MDIKRYLKKIEVTQTELARQLHLSRPTLDSYITQYENTGSLPKEKFKIIFDELFGGTELTKQDFMRSLLDFAELISQDEKYEVSELEPRDTDLFMSVMSNMRRDMQKKDHSDDVYRYINMIISNYHREDIFKYVADYFLFLNGLLNENEISEKQKECLAYLFNSFSNFPNDQRPYDYKEKYKSLLRRREEIREEKDRRTKRQKDKTRQLMERVQDRVNVLEENGVDVSDQMLDDIISDIVNAAE
ncbi:MAG: helix-turn-helix domain-containing protein [Wujia sp.]